MTTKKTNLAHRSVNPTHANPWILNPIAFTVLGLFASMGFAQEAVLEPIDVTESINTYKSEQATIGKVPLKPREIPNSVSVVTRKQIEEQNLNTVHEAMVQTTGINAISNDTTNTQYYARGYGLGVMYDGVTSYNGMTPSHQFDLPLYERVEVLRGPAGLLRGSGEPGGVVNFVKKRPLDTFGASWAATGGSWNNYRLEGDVTGPLNKSKTLRGRLVVAGEDKDYFYDHTHSKKWLGMAALEYDLTPKTTLSVSYSAQNQDVKAPWLGLPASSVQTGDHFNLLDVKQSTFNVPDWGKLEYGTQETTLGAQYRFDSGWTANIKANHRTQNQYSKYAYTSSGLNPTTNQLNYASSQGNYDYTRDGIDVYANGPFKLFGRRHNALIGYNAELYKSTGKSGTGPKFNNVPFGDLSTLVEPTIAYTSGSDSETRQNGFYGQARFSISDPITLVLGGRTTTFKARTRSIAPSVETAWKDGAKADNKFTPYYGLLYNPLKWLTVYGSYTDIFVPQTQLKADGASLDPRVGHQLELGAKTEFFNGQLGANLALFNIKDTGRAYADPAYPTSNFYLNAGKVKSEGIELEVTGQPIRGLDITAGYTYLTTKYEKDPTREGWNYHIQTPKNQFKLWGNYKFAGNSKLAGLNIGLGLLANSRAQSSRGWYVLNGGTLWCPGYAVVNAQVGYKINNNYSVNLAINNVFDRKYYASVGTPNIYNFYGDPRKFTLTLRGKY